MNSYLCYYTVRCSYSWGYTREFPIVKDLWQIDHPENLPRLIKLVWQLTKNTQDVEIIDLIATPLQVNIEVANV